MPAPEVGSSSAVNYLEYFRGHVLDEILVKKVGQAKHRRRRAEDIRQAKHRLNPTRVDAIRSALNRIRSDSNSLSGSVLITTAHGKFFSNGYDLAWAGSSPEKIRLLSSKLRDLVADLISFPMPTSPPSLARPGSSPTAMISPGQALHPKRSVCAAGMIFALCHDYAVMRKDRGFVYMSEMDIGLKISAWFMAVISCKIGDARVRRNVVLGARKLNGGASCGERNYRRCVRDGGEDSEGALELGEKLVRKGNGQVYNENRKQLYKDFR
ncbi:Zinc knuckle family protein isoform 1 [Hibiscus syriacus]|uniref:Zinc knuckle family protein isoform 1 n=1 Tax=Hibiscus syriacus TaxID=106335 RepID=A0A6A3BD44_HIBSY|nr:Zinc knuckle family protein isoform 1 [Hibiscus syriacus]